MVFLHVVLPAMGLGWVLTYEMLKPSHFLLSWIHNEPYTGLGFPVSPVVLCLALAGIMAVLAWFLPSTIMAACNAAFHAGRRVPAPGAYRKALLATMPSFAVHLAFLALAFLLMTNGHQPLARMWSIIDIVFVVALVLSLAWSLAGMTVAVKNVFGHPAAPSLLGIAIYAGLLVAVVILLFF